MSISYIRQNMADRFVHPTRHSEHSVMPVPTLRPEINTNFNLRIPCNA